MNKKYFNGSELQNSEHLNSESFFDDDLTKLNVRQIQTDQEKFVSTDEVPSHLEMTVDTGIEIKIIRKARLVTDIPQKVGIMKT